MKTIITRVAILTVFLLYQKGAKAQSNENNKYGIYANANDFIHHQLSYAFNKADGKNRLVLFSVFGSSKIEIIENGEKKLFNKKDIYGYRNKGIDYRIFNGEAYQIVDTTDFMVYTITKEIPIMKAYEEKHVFNYFSLTPNSNLQALNKKNIANAFPYVEQFDRLLETSFKSDEDLITYDSRIKKYKLKYLYEEFEKNTAAK